MAQKIFDNKFRALENFHIVLWLVKDLCWCMIWRPIAIFMIIPTFIFAVYITYHSRSNKSELFHNLAVIMWIMANSTWMIGEFYFQDGLKEIALTCFVCGLLLIGYFYAQKLFGVYSAKQ
jgi:hypothetical protein